MPLLPHDDLPIFRMVARNITAGAVKAVKAAAGVGLADEATIASRRAKCAACPERVEAGGILRCGPLWRSVAGKASTCGCVIAAKTRLRSERCPLGEW